MNYALFKIKLFSIHFLNKVFQDGTGMYPGSDVITINSTTMHMTIIWSGIDILVYDYSTHLNYKTMLTKQ